MQIIPPGASYTKLSKKSDTEIDVAKKGRRDQESEEGETEVLNCPHALKIRKSLNLLFCIYAKHIVLSVLQTLRQNSLFQV